MSFGVYSEFGHLVFYRIDMDAFSMSIGIHEKYQGNGWSRVLFQKQIEYGIHHGYLNSNTILAIDADASCGFWDHIGMTLNRYGFDYRGNRNLSAKGYEKLITVRELGSFLHAQT